MTKKSDIPIPFIIGRVEVDPMRAPKLADITTKPIVTSGLVSTIWHIKTEVWVMAKKIGIIITDMEEMFGLEEN
jgi:hypothetical protein